MKKLEVSDLSVNYGMIRAVRNVSFDVNEGEIVSLIGANGAGKSTIMNTIMGLVKPAGGSIRWNGEDITNKSTEYIVRKRIVLCPEGRQIFPELTVLQNLRLGAYTVDDSYLDKGINRAFELFPRLAERKSQMGGTLSGGEQQMLSVARAIMSEPDLLMLDEPSLGLAPLVVRDIFDLILKIREEMNMTVILVEQNAKQALKIADRGYVLETGEITMTDTGPNLLNSSKVREAYLGGR